jgi:hypothetical protein
VVSAHRYTYITAALGVVRFVCSTVTHTHTVHTMYVLVVGLSRGLNSGALIQALRAPAARRPVLNRRGFSLPGQGYMGPGETETTREREGGRRERRRWSNSVEGHMQMKRRARGRDEEEGRRCSVCA